MLLAVDQIGLDLADLDTHIARNLCHVATSQVNRDSLAVAAGHVDTVVLTALGPG
jgi:hypothetical protein